MKTKIYALYLPQFHEIKENNEWWGEGFTEWNNVKNSKKYYNKQKQPRIPINSYYYDLSKINDIKSQVELANKYGIDGFCIYHYYSKGKLLLETPAQLLLKNKNLNIDFFFCWGNHDWRRTWASFNKEILRRQEYGNYNDFIEHFNYLLPFFKDNRYQKINNKPVFCIYLDISKDIFIEMKKIWNKLAQENGFDGIEFNYVLKSKLDDVNKLGNKYERYYQFEPDYSRSVNVPKIVNILQNIYLIGHKIFNSSKPYRRNYRYTCQRIISNSKNFNNNKVMFSMFSGWDNSPRHKNHGSCYLDQSPDLFCKYLKIQYEKANSLQHPYLILNSWNEWGEGSQIEPDEYYKYKYLEAVKKAKS